MASVAIALQLPEDIYPESDGQPMAEADRHRKDMTYLVDALGYHFRDRPDVYVTGNLFLYYEEGNPAACVAPDLFVVVGVAPGDRKTYRLWEEGRVPSMVVEVTSKSTQRKDQEKKSLYARLGVREYFMFDPEGDYLQPSLQGFRLRGRQYRPLGSAADGSLRSRALGLTLTVEGNRLRMIESATGVRLLRLDEAHSQTQAAENEAVKQAARAVQQATRAAQEATARRAAEQRSAEEAAARRAAEEQLAEEAAARRAAEERIARLEEKLARIDRRQADG